MGQLNLFPAPPRDDFAAFITASQFAWLMAAGCYLEGEQIVRPDTEAIQSRLRDARSQTDQLRSLQRAFRILGLAWTGDKEM